MRTYLKQLRKSQKLTQEEMAHKINLTRQMYNAIENGKKQADMTVSFICKLANVLKVAPQIILENELSLQYYYNQKGDTKQ